MQQTKNYKLKLIETGDVFSPDALNENAETLAAELARVDAATAAETARVNTALAQQPRIAVGTYVGKNAFGQNNPRSLDFANTLGCAPKLLIVLPAEWSLCGLFAINGMKSFGSLLGSPYTDNGVTLTWTQTGVKWYSTSGTTAQLDGLNTTYYYIAFA